MKKKVYLDFETFSEADITEVGAWKYSQHPSLDLLCLAYKTPGGPVHQYRPYEGDDLPYALFDFIEDGYFIEAWNVAFEYSVWVNHCAPKLGWPEIPTISWFDTAAKAAAHALPLALGNCCKVLGLNEDEAKLNSGKDLLRLFSQPQKNGKRILPSQSREQAFRLYDYNGRDIIAEEAIDNRLPDLKSDERDFWLIDQLVNRRGIHIDMESVTKIRQRVLDEMKKANDRLPQLSGGHITKISQTQRIVKFCQSCGVKIDNCQADTVDRLLAYAKKHPEKIQPKHEPAIEILNTRKWYGKSATGKYDKMAECADRDGKVCYTMVYHGAHTGRWAGRLIQPHNYFKSTIHKDCNIDDFVHAVANRPVECVEAVYQPYIHAAASATRPMLIAPRGRKFFIGDYNAIEARIVFWMAGDEAGLEYYRKGIDPYCEMATDIFGRPITKADEYERFIGKGIVLGAGFGLSAGGFVNTMATQWGVDIDPQIAKDGISAYREKHYMVVRLWNGIEKASMAAMVKPEQVFSYRGIKFLRSRKYDFLYMMLPSGRLFAYPEPEIRKVKTPWGAVKDAITYKTWDNNRWIRESTYGGKQTENAVQATARDVMRDGMIECEFKGHEINFTVHDELVIAMHEERAIEHAKEIHSILETSPSWAPDLPIKVEYKIESRYRK